MHNRALDTVNRAIKRIEASNMNAVLVPGSDEHRLARAGVAESMQGRIMGKAAEVLESIVPDDLADGVYTEIEYDDNNNIVHKRMYGARGVEKATIFGILTDKLPVSQKYLNELRGTQTGGSLLLPEDRDELMDAIRGKAESIEALRINFKDDAPDLATKVDAAEASYSEVVDPDIISLDDLDNPA